MTAGLNTLSHLQQVLSAGAQQTWAVVTQNPDGTVNIAIDVGPGPANETIGLLEGGQGTAGASQFPLTLMADIYDSPQDLPAVGVLSNSAADIGKYWIIYTSNESGGCTSSGAYIWFGTEYRFLPFGNEGPPGPYGVMKPFVNLIGPEQISQIEVSDTVGTAADPYLVTMELSIPDGPPGRCSPLAQFVDVDELTPPTTGQFLTCTERTVTFNEDSLSVWAPQDTGTIVPRPYIVPASAFQNQFGITFGDTEATIASFTVPTQAFDWKPLVWGQVQMWELGLSLTNAFSIGIEVYLGNPNPAIGTLVARGFGNDVGGTVTIMPHTSTPAHPTLAMNPYNSVGLVPAGHGGASGTLYVNIINDGNLITIYDYTASTAQLFVLACPATPKIDLVPMIYGSLSNKVTLQARLHVTIAMNYYGKGALSGHNVQYWPQTQQFKTSGTYTPPSWWVSGTDYLDLIAVGDGGGASTANDFGAGGPGGAGTWATATLHSLTSGSLTISVGQGGKGSRDYHNGTAGAGVTIKDGSTTKLSAAGGVAGGYAGGGPWNSTGWYGAAPTATDTYQGATYYGGATQTKASTPGNWPGGGGAGANQVFQFGGNGASGSVWVVARKGP